MERRRSRVRLDSDQPVEVAVAGVDGSWRLPADLQDLTGDGARLRVTCDLLPASVGGVVALWVSDGATGIELPIEARLTHRHREGESHVIGLQFVDLRTVGGLLQPVLGRKFNRRAGFRVTPSRQEGEVPVSLTGPRDSEPVTGVGRMIDVSLGGMGLDVPPDFERAMRGRDQLGCIFRLPTSQAPLGAVGRVVHRTLRNNVVRYGLMFEGLDDSKFRETHDAIRAYVIKRQSEMAEENELHNGSGIPLGALGPVARSK